VADTSERGPPAADSGRPRPIRGGGGRFPATTAAGDDSAKSSTGGDGRVLAGWGRADSVEAESRRTGAGAGALEGVDHESCDGDGAAQGRASPATGTKTKKMQWEFLGGNVSSTETSARRARRGRTAVAKIGTGDGGRGELAAAVTSRGSVGAGTLKPALIPC
jgi:hypothetical protein